jgi:hypothetical protein
VGGKLPTAELACRDRHQKVQDDLKHSSVILQAVNNRGLSPTGAFKCFCLKAKTGSDLLET